MIQEKSIGYIITLPQCTTSVRKRIVHFFQTLFRSRKKKKLPIESKKKDFLSLLKEQMDCPIVYLDSPKARKRLSLIKEMNTHSVDEWHVLPIFPQFSYQTGGLYANFFKKHLPFSLQKKLFWIPSYSGEKSYITYLQNRIAKRIKTELLQEENVLFLFWVDTIKNQPFDPYLAQCAITIKKTLKNFPYAKSCLASSNNWKSIKKELGDRLGKRSQILIIPLSTFGQEISEKLEKEINISSLKKMGLSVHFCKLTSSEARFSQLIIKLMQQDFVMTNPMLCS